MGRGLVRALERRPLVPLIRRAHRSLTDQPTRAASSVMLNMADGAHSHGRNRRALLHRRGAGERGVLRVATAWGTSMKRARLPRKGTP